MANPARVAPSNSFIETVCAFHVERNKHTRNLFTCLYLISQQTYFASSGKVSVRSPGAFDRMTYPDPGSKLVMVPLHDSLIYTQLLVCDWMMSPLTVEKPVMASLTVMLSSSGNAIQLTPFITVMGCSAGWTGEPSNCISQSESISITYILVTSNVDNCPTHLPRLYVVDWVCDKIVMEASLPKASTRAALSWSMVTSILVDHQLHPKES